MSEQKDGPSPPRAAGGAFRRRELLQGLAVGVSAGFAAPIDALPRPGPLEPAAAAELETQLRAGDWAPQALDAHQFATLEALCDRIVPGSREALAARFVDALLAVDTQDRRRGFFSAFGAIEGEALARHQRPFRALGAADQAGLLSRCAGLERGRREWVWTPGTPFVEPPPQEERLTLRDHFEHLKGWIADAYYSSEAGRKELGDTGQMFFTSFPDCTHKQHP